MKRLKIVTVVGARPQFVKAAVVSKALEQHSNINEVMVHTGQHYDENMSDRFFAEMQIPVPTYNLGVGSAGHGEQTGRMLQELERVLLLEQPDCVLVYGDTNSTLAATLAAAKLHYPVAHVEAGLRSHNRKMPEEINRVVTDHVAELLFAPTDSAQNNLINEGIPSDRIRLVGDVMYDAALRFSEVAASRSNILSSLGIVQKAYALATLHRAENTNDKRRLLNILEGLDAFSTSMPVILPIHPRTRHAIQQISWLPSQSVRLIDPVGYLDMTMLEKHAAIIATDSGGVQKEAYFHRVPCVTLREETEWIELLEIGANQLCPPISVLSITSALRRSVGTEWGTKSLFGTGDASQKIVSELIRLGKTNG